MNMFINIWNLFSPVWIHVDISCPRIYMWQVGHPSIMYWQRQALCWWGYGRNTRALSKHLGSVWQNVLSTEVSSHKVLLIWMLYLMVLHILNENILITSIVQINALVKHYALKIWVIFSLDTNPWEKVGMSLGRSSHCKISTDLEVGKWTAVAIWYGNFSD